MSLRIIASALLILIAAGCSTGSAPDDAPGPAAAGRLPALPAPSAALAAARRASALIVNEGSGYIASLPNANITVDGSTAIYSPNWGAGQSTTDVLAYGIYSFNLAGIDSRTLRLQDGNTSAAPEDIWVGLGDFESDTWQWQQGQQFDPLRFDIGGSISVDGDVVMALVITGHQRFRLNSATFLELDEVEHNDSQGSGVEADGWNFRGLTGSLGSSETHSGVDGDNEDWWRINAPFPEGGFNTSIVIQAIPYFSEGFPFTSIEVYNSSGALIADGSPTFVNFSPDDDNFTSAADLPLFVKVVLEGGGGYAEYELSSMLNSPASADLTAGPLSGALPLQVDFDASGSTSGNSPISYYQWYFTNHGEDDAQPQATTLGPTVSFTYEQTGFYRARVVVKNESGGGDSAFIAINAGDIPYDELEDNDSISSPSLLPGSSGSGWRGNVGFDPETPAPFHGWDGGYDGDNRDCIAFTVQPGESIVYSLTRLGGSGDFTLRINGSESPGDQSIACFQDALYRQYNRSSLATEPYLPSFVIEAGGDPESYGDYEISWAVGHAPHSQSCVPNTTSGPAPLTVTFTPGAVDDDGSIDHFLWDTDNDVRSDTTTSGPLELTFETAGQKVVRMFAVDDDGLTTSFFTETIIQVN